MRIAPFLRNLYSKSASVISPAIIPFSVDNLSLCLNLDQCNLQCIMCPQTYMREGNQLLYNTVNMAPVELRRLLSNKLLQNSTIGVVGGGEPFLYPYLDELLKYAPTNHRHLMIMTNGTLIHTIPFFWEVAQKARLSLMFSIDAATEQTYSRIRIRGDFSALMANIDRFVELKQKNPLLKIASSFVVLKLNLNELMDFLYLNSKWGAEYVHIHPAIPGWFDSELSIDRNDPYYIQTMMDAVEFCRNTGIATDPLETLIPPNIYKKMQAQEYTSKKICGHYRHDPRLSCSLPSSSMTITHMGDVFLCDTAFRLGFCVGNVFKSNLASVWLSPKWLSVRLAHRMQLYDLHPLCRHCLLLQGT